MWAPVIALTPCSKWRQNACRPPMTADLCLVAVAERLFEFRHGAEGLDVPHQKARRQPRGAAQHRSACRLLSRRCGRGAARGATWPRRRCAQCCAPPPATRQDVRAPGVLDGEPALQPPARGPTVCHVLSAAGMTSCSSHTWRWVCLSQPRLHECACSWACLPQSECMLLWSTMEPSYRPMQNTLHCVGNPARFADRDAADDVVRSAR